MLSYCIGKRLFGKDPDVDITTFRDLDNNPAFAYGNIGTFHQTVFPKYNAPFGVLVPLV
jgi:hypothetical protein